MLGGGSFTTQNKVLPGAYINFVSAASSVAVLSERGTAAIPLEFGWGPEKEAFVVTAQDYQEKCQEIFGYPADAPQMWQIRELFKNLTKGIFYRLNGGIKASCDYGEALPFCFQAFYLLLQLFQILKIKTSTLCHHAYSLHNSSRISWWEE
jgi:hypothetical protein